MRCLKITQNELKNIKKLYTDMMSNACYALFYREGVLFAEEIVALANKEKDKFFEIVKNELEERGWVEEITFEDDTITVKGSIEVSENGEPGCHRLRGIIRHIYETYKNDRVYCAETECEGMGGNACVFKIKSID